MNEETEDPLAYFERILNDPEYRALGQSFIRNCEYAIFLVKQHRENQDKLNSNSQAITH